MFVGTGFGNGSWKRSKSEIRHRYGIQRGRFYRRHFTPGRRPFQRTKSTTLEGGSAALPGNDSAVAQFNYVFNERLDPFSPCVVFRGVSLLLLLKHSKSLVFCKSEAPHHAESATSAAESRGIGHTGLSRLPFPLLGLDLVHEARETLRDS